MTRIEMNAMTVILTMPFKLSTIFFILMNLGRAAKMLSLFQSGSSFLGAKTNPVWAMLAKTPSSMKTAKGIARILNNPSTT